MSESSRTKSWSLPKLKRKTAEDLQKAIRLEAANAEGIVECVTCGARREYRQMHAGHFIGGRTNSILFEESNVHPQCIRCNNFLGGNQESYAAYMVERYGANHVQYLHRLRGESWSWSREELLEMRERYRQRWKTAEARLKDAHS